MRPLPGAAAHHGLCRHRRPSPSAAPHQGILPQPDLFLTRILHLLMLLIRVSVSPGDLLLVLIFTMDSLPTRDLFLLLAGRQCREDFKVIRRESELQEGVRRIFIYLVIISTGFHPRGASQLITQGVPGIGICPRETRPESLPGGKPAFGWYGILCHCC